MQPKIRARVRCGDQEVGEVTHVIVDPLNVGVSHIVVKTATGEWQVPLDGNVSNGGDGVVQLSISPLDLERFPRFVRDEYLRLDEVEIAHAERQLDVMPGDVLVPVPAMEQEGSRRSFFQNFTNILGALLALPLLYPVLRYILDPMYAPFNNEWIRVGPVDAFREPDKPLLFRFKKKVKEGYIEREYTKAHWALKASPSTMEVIYRGKEIPFYDQKGKVVWTNKPDQDVIIFSGKCPHLGCAYKWKDTRKWGPSFVCPCHLSVFEKNGEVITGPSPRPLDVLPVRVTAGGIIYIMDVEYKAGRKEQIRVV